MNFKAVVYDWVLRLIAFKRSTSQEGVRSRAPRIRKFLLFAEDDGLTLVAGPYLCWPMEYHHFLLYTTYGHESGDTDRCLGGGMLFTEQKSDGTHAVRLAFWKNCVCGKCNGELSGLEDELGAKLGCQVTVTI